MVFNHQPLVPVYVRQYMSDIFHWNEIRTSTFNFLLFRHYLYSLLNECRQAKRDLRDVESLRQNCWLFDVIAIAVPRQKNLVAYLGTFQSSITRNSLIHWRIEVKLVSTESRKRLFYMFITIFLFCCANNKFWKPSNLFSGLFLREAKQFE